MLPQKLIDNFESLSDDKKQEVIDFVEFLKQKQDKEDLGIVHKVVNENVGAWEALAKQR